MDHYHFDCGRDIDWFISSLERYRLGFLFFHH
jgi:hypothetical protein